MKNPRNRECRCIECRFCGLRVDFDAGSHYFCEIDGKPFAQAVLQRPACDRFEKSPAAGHWGP